MSPPARERRSRRWADKARDVAWKLAAVAVAYGMWLSVLDEKPLVSQLQVPVRFESLDPGLALVGDRPSSVEVQVQGAEAIIEDLHPIDVEARIDLGGFREGKHTVRLLQTAGADAAASPVIVPRRPGVQVIDAFPRAVSFELEVKLEKEVPLKPVFAGEPLSGFEVAEVDIVPSVVRLSGPESAVEPLTEVYTREIDLEDKRADLEQEVWIDVGSPDVVLSEPSARVRVKIVETMVERTFEEVAVSTLRGAYEAVVRPASARVKLRGPERLLAMVGAQDVLAYVDLQGLEPAAVAYRLPVQVTFTREQFRERIELVDLSEVEVEVELSGPPAVGEDDAARGG